MKITAEETFRAKAPKLMDRVIREFGFSVEDAAAVAGNGGHESGGFAIMQEERPTVPGSRGGYGWFQWTGPRRKAFEKFCAEMKLLPSSDAGNIEFLVHELKTTERAAVDKLKKAPSGMRTKVVAFEMAFERAGVKHYDSREVWARRALDAYNKVKAIPPAPIPPPPDIPAPDPVEPTPAKPKKSLIAVVLAAIFGGGAAYSMESPMSYVVVAVIGAALFAAFYFIALPKIKAKLAEKDETK